MPRLIMAFVNSMASSLQCKLLHPSQEVILLLLPPLWAGGRLSERTFGSGRLWRTLRDFWGDSWLLNFPSLAQLKGSWGGCWMGNLIRWFCLRELCLPLNKLPHTASRSQSLSPSHCFSPVFLSQKFPDSLGVFPSQSLSPPETPRH